MEMSSKVYRCNDEISSCLVQSMKKENIMILVTGFEFNLAVPLNTCSNFRLRETNKFRVLRRNRFINLISIFINKCLNITGI
jgi:hypothetical protein